MTAQTTVVSTAALTADAKNRALRTAVQGLAIDLAVAVLLVVGTALSTAQDWSEIQWALIGLTLAKTVVQTIVSFLMRRFATKENVLTPPAPQPEPAVENVPAEDEAHPDVADLLARETADGPGEVSPGELPPSDVDEDEEVAP